MNKYIRIMLAIVFFILFFGLPILFAWENHYIYVSEPFDYTYINAMWTIVKWDGPGYYQRFMTFPVWFNNIETFFCGAWPLELLLLWLVLYFKAKRHGN